MNWQIVFYKAQTFMTRSGEYLIKTSITIMLLSIGLSYELRGQEYVELVEVECKSQSENYQKDSMYVVQDCLIEDKINWIVGWAPRNLVGLKIGEKWNLIKSYNEKEEGHIVRSKFYKAINSDEYKSFSVFGMEDGDISIKIYQITDEQINYLNELNLLEKNEDGDYSNSPIEKMKVFRNKRAELRIEFEAGNYELYEAGKFIRLNKEVTYLLKGEELIRIDENDR